MTNTGAKQVRFEYKIKAHPTWWRGVRYRSRLEATWACFFDLHGVEFAYEPIDLDGWTPDFVIKWPCGHSECHGSHSLGVEVKPYGSVGMFNDHPANAFRWGQGAPFDGVAFAGINESVWLCTDMVHGMGGGSVDLEWPLQASLRAAGMAIEEPMEEENIRRLCRNVPNNMKSMWRIAQEMTRWRGPQR